MIPQEIDRINVSGCVLDNTLFERVNINIMKANNSAITLAEEELAGSMDINTVNDEEAINNGICPKKALTITKERLNEEKIYIASNSIILGVLLYINIDFTF